MFFNLNFSVNNYAAAGIIENFDNNIDWKMAFEKIGQLEKLVKEQDKRIFALEKRPTESEWSSVTEKLRKQNDRIAQLETKISKLEIPVADKENKSIREVLSTEVSKYAGNALRSEKGNPSKSTSSTHLGLRKNYSLLKYLFRCDKILYIVIILSIIF